MTNPERLWRSPPLQIGSPRYQDSDPGGWVEYIRADLHTQSVETIQKDAVAEITRLREIMRRMLWLDGDAFAEALEVLDDAVHCAPVGKPK